MFQIKTRWQTGKHVNFQNTIEHGEFIKKETIEL